MWAKKQMQASFAKGAQGGSHTTTAETGTFWPAKKLSNQRLPRSTHPHKATTCQGREIYARELDDKNWVDSVEAVWCGKYMMYRKQCHGCCRYLSMYSAAGSPVHTWLAHTKIVVEAYHTGQLHHSPALNSQDCKHCQTGASIAQTSPEGAPTKLTLW